ncbi:unnamed protein product [Chrysoparadoxa australica]
MQLSLLLPLGVVGLVSSFQTLPAPSRPPAVLTAKRKEPRSVSELSELTEKGLALHQISVRTNGGQVPSHPLKDALWERKHRNSKPKQFGGGQPREDGRKIGLAIEGGGMRGCVSAGMASMIHYLGLHGSFDAVYGSSAGSLIGSYFVSGQMNGSAVYHDILAEAGPRFLNKRRLAEALGIDSSVLRWLMKGKDDEMERSSEVISLEFLLEEVVPRIRPLDWQCFWANNAHQPLNVIVSGVQSMASHSLTSMNGSFDSLEALANCLKGSMLVPGLTGPLMTLPCSDTENGLLDCSDALVFEPLPYRSAVQDGCTDVLVLRSRPDGKEVLGRRPGVYERLICSRYFSGLHGADHLTDHMVEQKHLQTYAEDVLALKKSSLEGRSVQVPGGGAGAGMRATLLAIAPGKGVEEVNQLEMDRGELLRGCRSGAEAAYQVLATPEMKARRSGVEVHLLSQRNKETTPL